jgi:hypothetical protein
MDASEVIRRRLQSAQYANFIQTLQSKQPNCSNSTCSSLMTTCLRNFSSYEQRDNVMNGAKNCIPCSTICGTTTSITS